MKLLGLIFIFLCSQLVDSCLVVRKNACSCNNTFLDETNMESLMGTHPFYRNISSYTIRSPDDNCDDACPNSIECPSGYSLVVLDKLTATTHPSGSVSPTCTNKQWTIEGNTFDEIYTVCVNFAEPAECACNYTYLNETNIEVSIGTHSFYQNITSYAIRSPDDNCDDACPNTIECPSGFSLVVLDGNTAETYSSGSVSSSCANKRWTIGERNFEKIYAICVNFTEAVECACNYTYLDETNLASSIGSHQYFRNISSYPIRSPDDNCDEACPNVIDCPSGFTLMVLDDTNAVSYSSGSVSPSCTTNKWTIGGSSFDRIYAVCVNFSVEAECACTFEYLDTSNMATLVGQHAFYQNVTAYPTRSPDDTCDDMCPDQVDCPVGYSLVVFDSSDARVYPSGSVSPTCSLTTKMWDIEGNQVETLYSICVNYSSPILPCNCSYTYLDESTIFKYPHENVTKYPLRSPEESCGDSCPSVIECADGFTLTVLEQDGMLVYPSGINPTCVAASSEWYIGDHLVVHEPGLIVTCVNFSAPPQSCQCLFVALTDENYDKVLEVGTAKEHPFVRNLSEYSRKPPLDFCENGDCPKEIECEQGLNVVVFGYREAKVYSQSITPFCDPSSGRWNIENNERFSALFVTCSDYPIAPKPIEMNACQCPQIGWADQENIASMPLASYLAGRSTFAAENLTVSDECAVTVNVASREEDDFYFMIFGTNIMPIFVKHYSSSNEVLNLESVGLKCALKNGEHQWQYHGGEVMDISFALQSNGAQCTCEPFPGSTPSTSACENVEIACPNPTDVAYLYRKEAPEYEYLISDKQVGRIYDATCEAGNWWYMGMPLGDTSSWRVDCKPPQNIVNSKPISYNYQCGCRELVQITAYNGFLDVYDSTMQLEEYGMSLSTVQYEDCVPKISCKRSADLLVIFGRNLGSFLSYSPASPPVITCQPSSKALAEDPTTTSKFWFIDGLQLSEPAFACLTPWDQN